MKSKKIWAMLLAAATLTSMTACGKSKDTDSTENETTAAGQTTTAATEAATKDTPTTEAPASSAESVKVYYGWGSSSDEAKYTAEIFCPEGAEFDESTLESYEENGSVMMVTVFDEVNEYRAASCTYWHRDAYNNESLNYPIIAQLYFDGALEAETAAENSDCSQKVTPLGFKWNGYDVVLIETTYTFLDYGEQTDVFVGVEYDLDYWKTEEGTGKVQDLTTKALFGFDVYSLGMDDLTQEQYAWIAGELFGVDSGVSNPFAAEEETTEATVSIDKNALVGEWMDRTSDWEDTYIFNADGTGTFISGPEYDFTYEISGDTLTLTYAEDDVEEFTASVDGGKLVLVDQFAYEQTFEKSESIEETSAETETTEAAEDENPYVKAVVGTWKESETGWDETFTFNADGTGHYSCLTDGGTYECGFTYEFFRSDYLDIHYEDGDEGGFQIVIDGDTLTVRNDYVWDLAYTRQ